MGIYGLQKFMREKCENGYELVSLPEIAKLYRCKTGRKPVLIYDLKSCLFSEFYDPNEECMNGGLKKLKKNIEIFINDIFKLGIDLKVISSGIRRPWTIESWIKTQKINTANLENYYTGRSEMPPYKVNLLTFYMVLHLIFQTSDKCEFIRAEFKSDEYILNYLKTSSCFAVLTNDSLFILSEGAEYCLSARDLNRDTMVTYNYNRNNLAKCLNIRASQLPLFGSLFFGDAYYHSSFHQKCIKWQSFQKVAELVKKLPVEEDVLKKNVSDHAKVLQMNEEDSLRWARNLKLFLGCSEFDVPNTNNKDWEKILTLARQRFMEGAPTIIYELLVRQYIFSLTGFANVLKPSPGFALLPLRKEMYGILFFENPNTNIFVKEHCYEYCKDIGKRKFACRIVIFPLRNHPGLLKMWSQSFLPGIKEEKRKVFFRAIDKKMNPNLLEDIQEELLYPFLAVYYLYWISEIKLQMFEVKVLLIQAVLVNSLSEKEIEKIPLTEINKHVYNLSSWFIETVNHLEILNFICGEPFCLFKTNLVNYFDGKVLHYVFKNEKNKELEENKVKTLSSKAWEMFKFLEEKFYAIAEKCGHKDAEDEDIWRKMSLMHL